MEMKKTETTSTDQSVYVPPSFEVIDLVDTIGTTKGSYFDAF